MRVAETEGGGLIPELQEIGALRKVLPYGRYLTTMEELEKTYAPIDDATVERFGVRFRR